MEASEIINLFSSLVFFVVLYRMLRKHNLGIPKFFIIGTILVTLGNVFTVAEGFFLPVILNGSEHLSFTLGSCCFFLGSIQMLKRNG